MQLACSGLSAVYLAEKQGAVKVILKESVLPIDTSDQIRTKARQLFEREAALLAKLDHPRIVKVLDSFVEEGRDYIVLQYVPGINLRQMMQAKPGQDWHSLRKYGLQIVEIIDYLHSLAPPIVHRDLTPDNLIVNENGTITLIDFGASNEFVSQATGTLIGKQAYIPPEQFKGKASPASDIYAFGATMYFLAKGEDPTPLSVSGCPEKGTELDELISDCTQLDPAARPDAGALVDRCSQLCLIELRGHDSSSSAPSSSESSRHGPSSDEHVLSDKG
jgi:serine/threonine protein kinase